jgi:azurin
MIRKLVAISILTLASGHLLAAECSIDVDSTDQMTFTTKTIEIDKISKYDDMSQIATDGMSVGIDKSYLKDGDARVIAHTKVIGGGETDSVTFDVSRLDPAEKYGFFCSFPGHIGMMKGTVTVK